MSSSSSRTRVVVLACLLVAGGCAEQRYKVRLDTAGLEGAAAYEVVVLRVSCQQIADAGGIVERGWVVSEQGREVRVQWRAGESAPDLGQVEPGRYAIVGIVRGADCTVGWGGCIDKELERGGDATIVVPLQPVGGFGCLPGEVCAGEGLCGPAPQCDNVTIGCDNDGDGHRACLPEQAPPCDCRDDIGEVFPGAEEHCDGFDNDCNGEDDPPECAGCFDECPAFDPDRCERADCSTGECQILPRGDGADCVGESGAAVCCGGECDGACDPAVEPEERACGACGSQTRECGDDCQWGAWGLCDESGAGECEPGDARIDQPCGNCGLGLQDEVCSETCEWVAEGICTGAGVCAAGAMTEPEACGDCGLQFDTCLDDCTWEIGLCLLDPGAPVGACTDAEICCPNGSCGGVNGLECCGTDTSTCGPEARCQDWTCVAGICTEVDETAGQDPEDECGANCCNGLGGCALCG
jgi:hypothetical protein